MRFAVLIVLIVTAGERDDMTTFEIKNGQGLIAVNSPSGIGKAEVRRQGDTWPASMEIRLNLKGLEHFRVSNGKTQLEASVSVHEGKPVTRIWKDGNEDAPLDPKSRYWMEVRTPKRDHKDQRQRPVDGGSFVIRLPKALFEGNPDSITLDWIDFYR